MAFLMVMSIGGIMIGSIGGNELEYNGVKFTQQENVYVAQFGDETLGFNYLPYQVEDMNVSKEALDLWKNAQVLIITFDPDSADVTFTDLLRFDLETTSGKFIVGATNKETDKYDLPVLNCENATASQPVLFLKSEELTTIELEGNCIIATANNFEFLKIRDRLLYDLFGVME